MPYMQGTSRPTLEPGSPEIGKRVSSIMIRSIHALRNVMKFTWDVSAMLRLIEPPHMWDSNHRRVTVILPEVAVNSERFDLPGFLRALKFFTEDPQVNCLTELQLWHNEAGILADTSLWLGDNTSENVLHVTVVGAEFFTNHYNAGAPAFMALREARLSPMLLPGQTFEDIADFDLEALLDRGLVVEFDELFNHLRIIKLDMLGDVVTREVPLAVEMPS